MTSNTTPSSLQNLTPLTKWEYMTNRRSRKQASIFVLGATLLTLTALITKRSLHYRYHLAYPLFYGPSNAPLASINGRQEAIRALQLATANMISVTVLVGGGAAWAFDISSVNDLKSRIRGSLGAGKTRFAVESEKWFEEWLEAREKEKEKVDKDGAVMSGQDKEATSSVDDAKTGK